MLHQMTSPPPPHPRPPRRHRGVLGVLAAAAIVAAVAILFSAHDAEGQIICTDPATCVDVGARLASLDQRIQALEAGGGIVAVTRDSLVRAELATFATALEGIAASLRAAIPSPAGGGGGSARIDSNKLRPARLPPTSFGVSTWGAPGPAGRLASVSPR